MTYDAWATTDPRDYDIEAHWEEACAEAYARELRYWREGGFDTVDWGDTVVPVVVGDLVEG